MNEHTMKLNILTPERAFFDDEAEGLIVTAPDGDLCILPGHLPLVAPLMVGSLKIKTNGKWREAFTTEGYLEVGHRNTFVFVQACEWPEEIDARRAHEEAEQAREALRQKQSINEYRSAQITLSRAMARLRIKKHDSIQL